MNNPKTEPGTIIPKIKRNRMTKLAAGFQALKIKARTHIAAMKKKRINENPTFETLFP